MTDRYDFEDEEDDELDGDTKDRRKYRIKTKEKFKKRRATHPKKLKGYLQDKPRKRDWSQLMDKEDDYGDY